MDAGTVEGALVMRDMATQVIARVEQSLASFQKQLGQTAKATERAGTAMDAALGKKLQQAGSTLTSVGMKLSLGLTASLGGGVAAVTKFASEYETNMTRLITLSGVARDKVKEFGQEMMGLGKETGQGPIALSNAMLVVTSTGMKGAEAMDILKKSAQATSLGLGETKDDARALTSVMTAYGKENLNASKAADILYQTVVQGGAEASELAGTLGRVVGIASQVGVSFEEVGAYISTFTRLGVDASEATTSLRAVMGNLLSPTADANKALEMIGTSIEGVRASVKEKGLMETLLELQNSFGGNVTAMDALFGNVRALAGVMGNTGAQADAYRQSLEAIKNSHGDFDKAVQETSKTTAWTWATVKADAQAAAISLGNTLAPAVKALLDGFRALMPIVQAAVKAFDALPGPIKAAAGALVGLAIAAGPLSLVFGNVLKTVGFLLGSSGFGALVGQVKLLGTAMGAYGPMAGFGEMLGQWLKPIAALITKLPMLGSLIGLLTNPVTLVVAAIAGAVLAIRYFTGSWEKTWQVLKMVVPALWLVEGAWKVLKAAFEAAKPVLLWLWQVMKDIGTIAWDYLGKAWQWLAGIFKQAVAWVQALLAPLAGLRDAALALGASLLSSVVSGLQKFAEFVMKAFPPLRLLVVAIGYVIGKGKEWAASLHEEAEAIRAANQAAADAADPAKRMGAAYGQAGDKFGQAAIQAAVFGGATAGLAPATQAAGQAAAATGGKMLTLAQQLAASTARVNALTAEEKANIQAGIKMGMSTADIAAQLHVSEKVIELYKDRLEQTTKASKEAADATKGLKDKAGELTEVFAGLMALSGSAEGRGMLTDWLRDNADAMAKIQREAKARKVDLGVDFDLAAANAAAQQAADNAKEVADAQRKWAEEGVRAVREAAEERAKVLAAGELESLRVVEEYGEKMAQASLAGSELRIAQVQSEWRAAKKALESRTDLTKEAAARMTAAMDAYYQHQLDLAEGTEDTIVERMRAAGVATRSDLLKTAQEAVRDFEQMKDSCEFTADAMSKAFQDANVKTAAAFGKTATALQDLSAFFQQLGQIAQGAFGQILSGLGQVVANLARAKEENIKWGEAIKDSAGNVVGFKEAKWGVANPLFSKEATTQEKLSAGIASAGAVAQGAMNVWSATSSHRTAMGNAGAGALAGAQAGAAFGPWGMAIGAAAGFITGLIRGKPQWAKVQDQMAEMYGVSMSKEAAEALAKKAKDFKLNIGQASKLQMADLIQEGGGLNEKNISKYTKSAVELFDLIKRGGKVGEEAMDSLNKTMGLFGQYVEESGKLGDETFVAMLRRAQAEGLKLTEVTEYLKRGLGNVIEGLNAYFATWKGAKTAGADTKKELEDIAKEEKRIRDELARADDDRERGDLQKELDAIVKQRTELEKQGTAYDAIQKALGVTTKSGEAFAASLSAAFQTLVANGVPATEIITQMEPSIDALGEQLADLGISGGPIFDSLKAKLALMKDETAGPVLQAMQLLGNSMRDLYNTGQMDASMFQGLASQVGQAYSVLLEQGKGGKDALALLQPQLQTLWELQQRFGVSVDESTQKMLDEAQAAGLVGQQHKSVNEQMLDATNRMVTALEGVARAMGVDLPAAANQAASGINDALGRVRTTIPIRVRYSSEGEIPTGGTPEVPEYGQGGVVTQKHLAYVGDTPEAIIPLDQLETFIKAVAASSAGAVAGAATTALRGGGGGDVAEAARALGSSLSAVLAPAGGVLGRTDAGEQVRVLEDFMAKWQARMEPGGVTGRTGEEELKALLEQLKPPAGGEPATPAGEAVVKSLEDLRAYIREHGILGPGGVGDLVGPLGDVIAKVGDRGGEDVEKALDAAVQANEAAKASANAKQELIDAPNVKAIDTGLIKVRDGLDDVVGAWRGPVVGALDGVVRALREYRPTGAGAPETQLAGGGVVTAPTTATVGEGGEAEAVVPLSRLESWINAVAAGGRDRGYDPRFAQDVADAIVRGLREGGAGGNVTLTAIFEQAMKEKYVRDELLPEIIQVLKKGGGLQTDFRVAIRVE
jgi:TP901 family phage tail tape measure protein